MKVFERTRTVTLVCALVCATTAASLLAGCASDDQDVDATISIAGASPTPDAVATRDREVAEVYAAAKAKDISRLLGFTTQMPAPSPSPVLVSISATASPIASTLPQPATSALATSSPTPIPRYDPAIALALYVVDPKTYTDAFVASYPTDPDGIMLDYGSRFVAARVDSKGALFPITSLASIAGTGDERALRRLYDALPASKGGIQKAYAREIAAVSAHEPNVAIAGLADAKPAARLDVLASAAWCGGNGTMMMSAATTTDFQAALKNDLGDAIRTQCAPAPRKRTAKRGKNGSRKSR